MLMDIKCSAVMSVKVDLTYDDRSVKENIISIGDLISVDYNANGLRKHIDGKVIKINAVGTDPKGWYIIVDGSDDFDSDKAKFSPMSILDLEVIRKADTLNYVQTPIGSEGVPYLRIRDGKLEYSKDGFTWLSVDVHPNGIEDQEGTVPDNDSSSDDTDGIEDANW